MPDIHKKITALGGVIDINRPPLRPPINFWRSVVVNFDNVASATAVDTVYANEGVTFASLTTSPAKRWSAYAMLLQMGTAQTGKNVLTLSNKPGWGDVLFDGRQGAVEATFSQLQHSVTVWAFPMNSPEGLGNADNRPFIDAFDANGAYLGKARTQFGTKNPDGSDNPNYFARWHPITFVSSGGRNIKTVRLSSQAAGAPWVYTVFNTLTFERNILIGS